MSILFKFVLATGIVLLCSTELRSSDFPKRSWRVTYCEEDGDCFRGKPMSLKDCIEQLKTIWEKERYILSCSAEPTKADKEREDASPQWSDLQEPASE